MDSKDLIIKYRKTYAKVLNLYPRSYRQRFGEGMEQTFVDVLNEQYENGRDLFASSIWMYIETFRGIISENIKFSLMKFNNIVKVFIATLAILLIPLVLQLTIGTGIDGQGFNWTFIDFVVMGILIFTAGTVLDYIVNKVKTPSNRIVAIIAALVVFLLVWAELAVGIFNTPFAGS